MKYVARAFFLPATEEVFESDDITTFREWGQKHMNDSTFMFMAIYQDGVYVAGVSRNTRYSPVEPLQDNGYTPPRHEPYFCMQEDFGNILDCYAALDGSMGHFGFMRYATGPVMFTECHMRPTLHYEHLLSEFGKRTHDYA